MTQSNRMHQARRSRRGAGLVEIVLAMVIFAFIATSYAAVTLKFGVRMKTVSAGAARSAALAEYMNRVSALAYADLDAAAGTVTTTTGDFPNTRVITVTTSGMTKTVTIVLTPTNTAIKPDTVIITRRSVPTGSPLG
jgi:type II secretory pathway component PulJ